MIRRLKQRFRFERRYYFGLAVAGALVFGGFVLWLAGVLWGTLLAAAGTLVFIVAAWIGVQPEGGHVHHDIDPWAAG